MFRIVHNLVLAIALLIAALALQNMATQQRVAQVGIRRCSELASGGPIEMCMDVLDLRTLGVYTIKLPTPDQAVSWRIP